MAFFTTGFDPYRKWLGIPENRRPPTYYDILGITRGENDDDVVRSAAEQRRNFIQSKRGEGHDKEVAKILQEIDESVACLLVQSIKSDYDRRLGITGNKKGKYKNHPLPPWFDYFPVRIYGEGSGLISSLIAIVAVIGSAFGLMLWFSFQMPWERPKQEQTAIARRVEKESSTENSVEQPEQEVARRQTTESNFEHPTTVADNVNLIDDWISLFDGKSLSGWVGDTECWNVVDGTLIGKLSAGESEKIMRTTNSYSDFELRAKFQRLSGNSGINFRSRFNIEGKFTGPQAEIADEVLPLRRAVYGELYDLRGGGGLLAGVSQFNTRNILASVAKESWSELSIIAKGPVIKTAINGIESATFTSTALPTSGIVGLQLSGKDGASIRFKHIQLRTLEKQSSASNLSVKFDTQTLKPPKVVLLNTMPVVNRFDILGWASTNGEVPHGGHGDKPRSKSPLIFEQNPSRNGIYQHASGQDRKTSLTFLISKEFSRLETTAFVPVALSDQGNPRSPLIFEIYGDGRLLWGSDPLTFKGAKQDCKVSVEGVDKLLLQVYSKGANNWGLCAWHEPRLTTSSDLDKHGSLNKSVDAGSIAVAARIDTNQDQQLSTRIDKPKPLLFDKMQGEWLTISAEEIGNMLSKETVDLEKRRFSISGNKLTVKRLKDGKWGTYTGDFRVDTSTSHFDFTGTGPAGFPIKWTGIVECDDKILKLCYRYDKDGTAVRPTRFKTDYTRPNISVLYIAKREK